jgi:hypothetical protein
VENMGVMTSLRCRQHDLKKLGDLWVFVTFEHCEVLRFLLTIFISRETHTKAQNN